MRGTLQDHRSSRSIDLQTKTTNLMENSQHFPHKHYKENETYGQNFTEPPPELVEGEEVYKVETILNHQKRGCGYQYYIKWQGYLGFRGPVFCGFFAIFGTVEAMAKP